MSSPNKITFGNKPATSYTINNSNFGYASGDSIPAYQGVQTSSSPKNGILTTNTVQLHQQPRQVIYGGQSTLGYSGANYSTVNVGVPTNVQYESARTVHHHTPTTKVTFGGKQYTETYGPRTNYVAPVQTYQTYQTYRQPTQIREVISQPIITPQVNYIAPVQTYQAYRQPEPIREEFRYEKKVEAPRVQTPVAPVAAVPAPVVEKPKTKKPGCPAWLWPLLGIIALLALILGLLFGLGVFGGKGGASANALTKNEGYTVMDEQVILSKDTNSNVSGSTTTTGTNSNTTGTTGTKTNTTSTTSTTSNTAGTTSTQTNMTGTTIATSSNSIQPMVFSIDPVQVPTTSPSAIPNLSSGSGLNTRSSSAVTGPTGFVSNPSATGASTGNAISGTSTTSGSSFINGVQPSSAF